MMSEQQRCDVLVVDDDRDSVDSIAMVLEDEGLRCATATNGAAAVRLLWAERPRVVLVDVVMQGIDGLPLPAVIRQKPELADTPVILMTGSYSRSSKPPGVLLKPFTRERLLDAIRPHLKS
jgi:CheY-like chemotaxis protein